MEIRVTELKRCVLLKLEGRFDSSRAVEVEKVLNQWIEDGHYRFVMDMSGVDYVSSAFLRVLISSMKAVKRWNRGNIYLAEVQPRIVEVLDLAGLLSLFKIYDSVAEAVGDW